MDTKSFGAQIVNALAKKLGHEPTPEELRKELNGAGLIILAEQLIKVPKEEKEAA
jgi:phosphoglycolate phosphatase-like HAD superfamily hydrolase